MAVPSSLTLNYNAILSSTLFNYRRKFEDCISSSNALLYVLTKKQKNGYVSVGSPGDRAMIPLMYELGQADSYTGYDTLGTEPIDGLTAAFYEWRQAAIPVSISGREELINEGEARLFSLIQAKTFQAEMGIKEFFGKAFLQGAGGSSVVSPYTSAANGSTFIDPIGKLVYYDPSASVSIGNINQNTYTWWRNKKTASSAASCEAVQQELRHLYNECGKGPGGSPNLIVSDQQTYEFYEYTLAKKHENPSYQKADIPFENILFKGQAMVWDEWVPNAKDGKVTQEAADGTIYMLNTNFLQIQYHPRRNFAPTNMQQPENQDARVSHLLWFGAALCSNRRKQGVISGINTALTT
jgi:hypothetical protein